MNSPVSYSHESGVGLVGCAVVDWTVSRIVTIIANNSSKYC